VRIAHARIAAGQSELTLVGGAYNGTRWDIVLIFEQAGVLLKDAFAPVWDRGPQGGFALGNMGAFLVLESPDHARARGARAQARIASIASDRNPRQPGQLEASLRRQWDTISARVDRAHAAIISGATGIEPVTSAEHAVLKELDLPVRNTGSYIGHGLEAQFVANLAIACAVLRHGKLFAPAGTGDVGASAPGLSQVVVTSVGNWRGEGLALVERVE
jgi:3-oxoacyl-[acyl-carrier-protein] synthase II